MSWPVWNQSMVPPAGTGLTQDQSLAAAAGYSGYTPEQWATLQQQNWQQWSQWQEQYNQWQMHYGEKYAEQLRNSSMPFDSQPPLPSVVPSKPPPPPPSGPPPPPPEGQPSNDKFNRNPSYKNMPPNYGGQYNQKTYGQQANTQYNANAPNRGYANTTSQHASNSYQHQQHEQWNNNQVQVQVQNDNRANKSSTTGKSSSKSSQAAKTEQEMNEEERLFDEQFRKWEEDFLIWKEQNANHPDKNAYREYEQKFEACRAQLIERKKQMNAKRLAASAKSTEPQRDTNQQQNEFVHVQDSGSKENTQYSNEDLVNDNSQSSYIEDQNSSDLFPNIADRKGIPGLDLVENVKNTEDVIILEGDERDEERNKGKPDLLAISKGIDSILGDRKLLDMISMVRSTSNVNPQSAGRVSRWSNQQADSTDQTQGPPNNSGVPPPFQQNSGFPQANIPSLMSLQVPTAQNTWANAPPNPNLNANMPSGQGNTLVGPPDHRPPADMSIPPPGITGGMHDMTNIRDGGMSTAQGTAGFQPNMSGRINKSAQGLDNPGSSRMSNMYGAGSDDVYGQERDYPGSGPGMENRGMNFGGNKMDTMHRRGMDDFHGSGTGITRRQGTEDEYDSGMSMPRPGMGNMQRPGMSNMQRPGMGNMQRPGMGNMQRPGMDNYGPEMDNYGPEMDNYGSEMDNYGPEMDNYGPGMDNYGPGKDNKQGSGMGNMQRRGMNNMQRPGMDNMQRPGMDNMQGPGMNNIQRPGRDIMQRPGRDNMQRPGMSNMQRQGMDNVQRPGANNMQTGEIDDVYDSGMDNMQNRGINNARNMGMNNMRGSGFNRMRGSNMGDYPPEMDNEFGQMDSRLNDRDDNIDRWSEQEPSTNAPYYQQFSGEADLPPSKNRSFRNNHMFSVDRNINAGGQQPVEPEKNPEWLNTPLIEPITIVDYQHMPRKMPSEFHEPSQIFDYNHKSKDDKGKKPQTEKILLKADTHVFKSVPRDDYLKNIPTEPIKSRESSVEFVSCSYDDKTRDERHDRYRRGERYEREYPRSDRLRDDRERGREYYSERDDHWNYRKDEWRDGERSRDKGRWEDDYGRRDTDRFGRYRRRSISMDRSRGSSVVESDVNNTNTVADPPLQGSGRVIMIDDLLELPGRDTRPQKIVVILRGLPGSGKSYLAKLIKEKEQENGGTSLRILSIDDYFVAEVDTETKNPDTGRKEVIREMKYEFDKSMEAMYIASLIKSFKKTVTDGFFSFIIVDAVNDQFDIINEMSSFAKQKGFTTYVCEMENDVQACFKHNIHNRTLKDIEDLNSKWFKTPLHCTLLDTTTLLQSAAIDDVQMEDVCDEDLPEVGEDQPEEEVQLTPFSSKWDRMDDMDIAKLDGTSKPLRHAASMEDYLQLDEWTEKKASQPGKKTVRWADIEEHRKQEKMRAVGFVVGQTDWQRMMDPTMGSGALTQTKYIERVKRN